MMMLLDNTNSIGRLPSSELWDKLRCNNPVRLLRDGEMLPLRPLAGSKTSVTTPLLLQVIPCHWQQFVMFNHDMRRPPSPSCKSPSRKSMRELLSCSVHELVREAQESRRTKARTKNCTGGLVLVLLRHGKLSGCMTLEAATEYFSGAQEKEVKGTAEQVLKIRASARHFWRL
ncbi:hypothetical protein EJB05_42045, partial [Eragrostis curvula]